MRFIMKIVVAISFMVFTHGQSQENFATWSSAHIQCSGKGGGMFIQNGGWPENLRGVISKTPMWLGGRLVHTSWTWTDGQLLYKNKGCYRAPGNLQLKYTGVAEAFDCYLMCKSEYKFALISSDQCTCLDYIGNLSRTGSDNCHYKCARNFDEACGGPGYVSIYERSNEDFPFASELENTDRSDCGYLSVDMGTIGIRTDKCGGVNAYKRAFCRDVDDKITRVDEYTTWQRSCLHSFRAHVTKADQLQLDSPRYFWIGLNRSTIWRWNDGRSAKDWERFSQLGDTEGDCLAAYENDAKKIFLKRLPCEERHRVVCLQGMTKRTTSTRVTLETTSSRSTTTKTTTHSTIIHKITTSLPKAQRVTTNSPTVSKETTSMPTTLFMTTITSTTPKTTTAPPTTKSSSSTISTFETTLLVTESTTTSVSPTFKTTPTMKLNPSTSTLSKDPMLSPSTSNILQPSFQRTPVSTNASQKVSMFVTRPSSKPINYENRSSRTGSTSSSITTKHAVTQPYTGVFSIPYEFSVGTDNPVTDTGGLTRRIKTSPGKGISKNGMQGVYIGLGVAGGLILLVLILAVLAVLSRNKGGQSKIYRVGLLTRRSLSQRSSNSSTSRENLVDKTLWGKTAKRVKLQSVTTDDRIIKWRDDNWGFEMEDADDSVFAESPSPGITEHPGFLGVSRPTSLSSPDPLRTVHFEDEVQTRMSHTSSSRNVD